MSATFYTASPQPVANTHTSSRRAAWPRSIQSGLPKFSVETKSGAVAVSTRALTLLDIASDTVAAGGINNVVNLVIELCETTVPFERELPDIAPRFPATALRRLGWIMENFTSVGHLASLAEVTSGQTQRFSKLDPLSPHSGKTDSSWHLCINTKVESDV